MRLIELTDSGEPGMIRELFQDIPPYAILSHTWGVDEVSFRNLLDGTGRSKTGYAKVQLCGEQARKENLNYIWVDTCCIDKACSGELEEAINSMFHWYREAARCYVHLSDVTFDNWESEFPHSRWFRRCWTLQELIAPKSVVFFTKDGKRIGDKLSMLPRIQKISGIQVRALLGHPLSDFTQSERVAWTVGRRSTRGEDQAYSLLGIFDINMRLRYGEGKVKALQRLQEKITKSAPKTLESSPTSMRLIVAGSDPLQMEVVPANEKLQYAILSHTWGKDEISFSDVRSATMEQRQGYSKIRKCCDVAAQHGFNYVWVDTCCIDKSSSSELQEAICSMYRWYKHAMICYVYLEDFDLEHDNAESLAGCKWFTRGWTLQELIAPVFVEFYDKNWNEIGTKQSLCDQIAKITSIDPLVLRGADPTERTVAERMSWAASRSTTRIEDSAYSLMGLFNVFMPMLYGEGRRAFIRLQEEIIKQTEDYTIFSWKANTSTVSHRGIFAHSPAEFSVVRPEGIGPRFDHLEYRLDQHPPPAMTSRGLMLTLPVLACNSEDNAYLGWVSCSSPPTDDSVAEQTILCIKLRKIHSDPQVFARISSDKLEACVMSDLDSFEYQTLCVLPSTVDQPVSLGNGTIGEVVVHPFKDNGNTVALTLLSVAHWAQWWREDHLFTYSTQEGTSILAAIQFKVGKGFVVIVGFQEDLPWCSIVTYDDARIQGRELNTFDDIGAFFRSSARHTDRARGALSANRMVTAAMRVSSFTDPSVQKFGLHITLSNSTLH